MVYSTITAEHSGCDTTVQVPENPRLRNSSITGLEVGADVQLGHLFTKALLSMPGEK